MTLVYKKVAVVNKATIHHHSFKNIRLGFGEIAGDHFGLGFGHGIGHGFGSGFGFGFGRRFGYGFGFGIVTIETYNRLYPGKTRIVDGTVVDLELLEVPGEPFHYHFVSVLDRSYYTSVYQLGPISEPGGTIGQGCDKGIHVFTTKQQALDYDFT